MPLFEYSGFDRNGKKVSGVLEGGGRRAALTSLRQQGIHPTSLREEQAAGVSRSQLSFSLLSKVSRSELAIATRQLATLITAGLALDEALATVVDQQENPQLGRNLGRVRDEVIQGESLHAALARYPRIFPPIYVNMVEVGESSGTLDQVLERLADFLEEQARLQGRLSAALAYPILMALVGVGILIFLVTYVLPKVTRMLVDLDQALPLPTRLLIALSNLLSSYWWLLLILLVAAAIFIRRWSRTPKGRLNIDRWSLRLPLIGRLQQLIATARLCRTLATLLHSGVPLLKALEISSRLLRNQVLRQAIEETGVAVREGEGVAEPLKRSGVFPPMVHRMIAVGERSGDLEGMLFKVAAAYEHQIELSMSGMLAMLEPLMILLMGGAVGFIVLAILLPIFQASSGIK